MFETIKTKQITFDNEGVVNSNPQRNGLTHDRVKREIHVIKLLAHT